MSDTRPKTIEIQIIKSNINKTPLSIGNSNAFLPPTYSVAILPTMPTTGGGDGTFFFFLLNLKKEQN